MKHESHKNTSKESSRHRGEGNFKDRHSDDHRDAGRGNVQGKFIGGCRGTGASKVLYKQYNMGSC